MGQARQAVITLRKVNELVPEDAEVYQELGQVLGESGDEFAGNLNYAYSALYSNNIRKAQFHYQQAAAKADSEAQKKELAELKKVMDDRANPGM